jgi:hypothetical protein
MERVAIEFTNGTQRLFFFRPFEILHFFTNFFKIFLTSVSDSSANRNFCCRPFSESGYVWVYTQNNLGFIPG